MSSILDLSDSELKTELSSYGFEAGPVTGTTRKVYEKKLEAFRKGKSNVTKQSKQKEPASRSPARPSPKSGRKSRQVPEESDNEINFSLPVTPKLSSLPKGARQNNVADLQAKTIPNISGRSSTQTETKPKRKPTPPRAPKQKPTPKATLSSEGLYNDYDEEDDHVETSRILSPSQRFNPTAKNSYDYTSQNPSLKKNFGAKTWNFLSNFTNKVHKRDTDYKTTPPSLYEAHESRYSRYKPTHEGRFATQSSKRYWWQSRDISSWILIGLIVFTFILAITYVATAHPETLQRGSKIMKGAIFDTFLFFYNYAILPTIIAAIVIGGCFTGYFVYKKRLQWQEENKRQLLDLVERITDIIRDSGVEGIAEPHVRDMIMPPTRRTSSEFKLWQQAVDFINTSDSRVRTDVQDINGVECSVWHWIPIKKQGWQGRAVSSSSVPQSALTRCIKLRGMISTNERINETELRQELRSWLHPVTPIHIAFQTNPPEGIVYLMFKNKDDAKHGFLAFHSQWFNGNLVSAKYVRDERYMERFPEMSDK